MNPQAKDAQRARSSAQTSPVAQLQEHERDASDAVPSPGQEYVITQQIAELEAGHLPPPTASDPTAPGVQDLATGGTSWLAQVNDQPLSLYTAPDTSSAIATIAADAQVSVLAESRQGSAWLRVRTAEGQEGWVESNGLRST